MPTTNTRIMINKQIALNFINAINNYFFTSNPSNHSDLFTFNFFVLNPEELKQILNQKDKDAIKNYFKQHKINDLIWKKQVINYLSKKLNLPITQINALNLTFEHSNNNEQSFTITCHYQKQQQLIPVTSNILYFKIDKLLSLSFVFNHIYTANLSFILLWTGTKSTNTIVNEFKLKVKQLNQELVILTSNILVVDNDNINTLQLKIANITTAIKAIRTKINIIFFQKKITTQLLNYCAKAYYFFKTNNFPNQKISIAELDNIQAKIESQKIELYNNVLTHASKIKNIYQDEILLEFNILKDDNTIFTNYMKQISDPKLYTKPQQFNNIITALNLNEAWTTFNSLDNIISQAETTTFELHKSDHQKQTIILLNRLIRELDENIFYINQLDNFIYKNYTFHKTASEATTLNTINVTDFLAQLAQEIKNNSNIIYDFTLNTNQYPITTDLENNIIKLEKNIKAPIVIPILNIINIIKKAYITYSKQINTIQDNEYKSQLITQFTEHLTITKHFLEQRIMTYFELLTIFTNTAIKSTKIIQTRQIEKKVNELNFYKTISTYLQTRISNLQQLYDLELMIFNNSTWNNTVKTMNNNLIQTKQMFSNYLQVITDIKNITTKIDNLKVIINENCDPIINNETIASLQTMINTNQTKITALKTQLITALTLNNTHWNDLSTHWNLQQQSYEIEIEKINDINTTLKTFYNLTINSNNLTISQLAMARNNFINDINNKMENKNLQLQIKSEWLTNHTLDLEDLIKALIINPLLQILPNISNITITQTNSLFVLIQELTNFKVKNYKLASFIKNNKQKNLQFLLIFLKATNTYYPLLPENKTNLEHIKIGTVITNLPLTNTLLNDLNKQYSGFICLENKSKLPYVILAPVYSETNNVLNEQLEKIFAQLKLTVGKTKKYQKWLTSQKKHNNLKFFFNKKNKDYHLIIYKKNNNELNYYFSHFSHGLYLPKKINMLTNKYQPTSFIIAKKYLGHQPQTQTQNITIVPHQNYNIIISPLINNTYNQILILDEIITDSYQYAINNYKLATTTMQKFQQQYANLQTLTIDDEEIIQLLNPIANFDATTCNNIISNNATTNDEEIIQLLNPIANFDATTCNNIISNNDTIPKTYYLNTPPL